MPKLKIVWLSFALSSMGTLANASDDCETKTGPVAVLACTERIQRNPNDDAAFFHRAAQYERQADYDRAISDFSRVLALNPKFLPVFMSRSRAYLLKGDFDHAIEDATSAMVDQRDNRPYYYRANAYRAKGDYNRAFADYNEYLRRHSMYAFAYEGRAWALLKLGKFQEALNDADRAFEIESRDAKISNTRGLIYESLGERDKAALDFKRALKLDPNDEESREGLKRLNLSP